MFTSSITKLLTGSTNLTDLQSSTKRWESFFCLESQNSFFFFFFFSPGCSFFLSGFVFVSFCFWSLFCFLVLSELMLSVSFLVYNFYCLYTYLCLFFHVSFDLVPLLFPIYFFFLPFLSPSPSLHLHNILKLQWQRFDMFSRCSPLHWMRLHLLAVKIQLHIASTRTKRESLPKEPSKSQLTLAFIVVWIILDEESCGNCYQSCRISLLLWINSFIVDVIE